MSIAERQQKTDCACVCAVSAHPSLCLSCSALLLLLVFVACLFDLLLIGWNVSNEKCRSSPDSQFNPEGQTAADLSACLKSCRIEVVESIPEDVSFVEGPIPRSTFAAWLELIDSAEFEIQIAAYKSSLRGKHVLGESMPSTRMGETIFDRLERKGGQQGVQIRMVENFPPKDRGDNEDGKSLARRGAMDARPLHYAHVMGSGAMHSKFLVVDRRHIYLGSANLDWRSLTQKMELGVIFLDCPCLAVDLANIFDMYWHLAKLDNHTDSEPETGDSWALHDTEIPATSINMSNPLLIRNSATGGLTQLYLASSPRSLNGAGRTWDLDAILEAINSAERHIYVHVMDYIPMIAYQEPQKYWPVIDDALRRAVLERSVNVKLLVAALHFVPTSLYFLQSLQTISKISSGSIAVKIFKVPAFNEFQSVIARERRTHNKFMVTDDTAIIGTSNWSGDYFSGGTTGVAVVIRQPADRASFADNSTQQKQPLISQMRDIFMRDWNSEYAHHLNTYLRLCVDHPSANANQSICETQKPKDRLHLAF